jgi:hypothetical protein
VVERCRYVEGERECHRIFIERIQLDSAFLRDPYPYGVIVDANNNQALNYGANVMYNGYTVIPYGNIAQLAPSTQAQVIIDGQPVVCARACEHTCCVIAQLLSPVPQPLPVFANNLPSVFAQQQQILPAGTATFIRVPYDPLGIRRPIVQIGLQISSRMRDERAGQPRLPITLPAVPLAQFQNTNTTLDLQRLLLAQLLGQDIGGRFGTTGGGNIIINAPQYPTAAPTAQQSIFFVQQPITSPATIVVQLTQRTQNPFLPVNFIPTQAGF